jgi:hypothetical protein
LNPTKWLPVENTTTDIIPSFAVAKVTDVVDGIAQIEQCDTDDDPGVIVLAGAVVPSSSSTGRSEGTYDPQVIVAYEESDGVPQPGEIWGPASGSWKLRSGRTGFQILGGAGGGVVNAVRIGGGGGGGCPSCADVFDIDTNGLTFTSNNIWETVDTLTLPSAGTYILTATLTGFVALSTATSSPFQPGGIDARIYDVDNATQVINGADARIRVVSAYDTTNLYMGSASITVVVTVSGSCDFNLDVQRLTTGGAVYSFSQIGTGGNWADQFYYIKLCCEP